MEFSQIIKIAGFVLFAFLCGAIPTGFLIVMRKKGIDIRRIGSGNIGSTNVRRVAGKKTAALVQILDILKGALPTGLALWVLTLQSNPPISKELMISMTGIAAVLGHNYTPFLGFRGGKGVNTTVGAFLIISPVSVVLAAVSYFITKYTVRIASVSSIILSIVLLVVIILAHEPAPYIGAAIAACYLIVVNHQSNIKRVLKGQEPRI
ncbi:MAG: glycerol-3-phosphate 1-O-acyltransferase PlsY [Bacteroidales bacterium]